MLIRQLISLATLILSVGLTLGQGAEPDRKTLHGHVPSAVADLTPNGGLAATNELRLALGVPLRDPAGLEKFLADVYDPASPNYRQFLTPEEFTARFCATEADYAVVKKFAETNGFKITGTPGNRLLLDVTARAADVERAFHFHFRTFKHPTEARDFFAPDAEPTVDANLPVADIQGLSDYSRPHPRRHKMDPKTVAPKNGSAPDGSSYFGNDFRNAYAPGVTLTGAGQSVGLLQFDGFYPGDIATYAQTAGGGRTNIAIQTVLLDGYNGVPTTGANSGNDEVSLDIEMAMSMAPGLAKIVVFEAGPSGLQNDILNSMVTFSNTVKQLSSSWGWSGGPTNTTDVIFQTMQAQGLSFFNASGDSDAFTVGANSVNGVDNPSASLFNAPSSCPYITQVGGTTLTMNGTGASYASETVWNRGSGVGSSGGVSSYYPIPSWQTNISMAANLGSTTQRNIPDVALTAESIYVYYGNGSTEVVGGTSCAAPLWAGFMALVNQQAASQGRPPAGFINPAIYDIGKGQNASYSYAACFHDTTSGNNYWSKSKTKYPATIGYDLCTGWGTPTGTNLISALVGASDALVISPASGFTASGVVGGPFTGAPQTFTLTNSSVSSLNWSLVNTSAWLTVSNSGGTLGAAKQTNVTVNLAAAANSLGLGNFTAAISFSNQTTHATQLRQFTLQTLPALAVSPAIGFSASGPAGGVFNVTAQNFALTNLSAAALNWGIVNTSSWLKASLAFGSLAGSATTNMNISLNASANTLPVGIYSASVLVTNQGITSATLPFTLQIGQSLVQNGGFETGDFSDWTLAGNTVAGGTTYNTVANANNANGWQVVHSGSYGAFLGDIQVATLSQVLATVPGQAYLLSLWLDNPASGSTQIFLVNWNTNNVSTNTIFNLLNPPVLAWTNLTFVVTATGTNTTLQIGAENDPNYFGLDDVSVTPIPTPTVTGFSQKTNSLTLTWNALAGVSYQVLFKTNLLQSAWLTNFTTTATGNLINFTNPIGPDRQRFYRVRQSP